MRVGLGPRLGFRIGRREHSGKRPEALRRAAVSSAVSDMAAFEEVKKFRVTCHLSGGTAVPVPKIECAGSEVVFNVWELLAC